MKLIIILMCFLQTPSEQQENITDTTNWMGATNYIGIQTNVLYWGALVPNLGVEYPFATQWSVNATGMYARWEYRYDKKFRVAAIQPEVRRWLYMAMIGHYIGVHLHYGVFNIGEELFRRDGWLIGGGVSYGYSWVLSPRFNLDLSASLGYARIKYKKYGQACSLLFGEYEKNYIGPTKLSVTFTYKIPFKLKNDD